MKYEITGQSDDTIIIECDAWDDEFPAHYARFLRFDDGTVVKAEYSPAEYDGKWKIEKVYQGSTAVVTREPATDERRNYSDRLTLDGSIQFIGSFTEESGLSDDDISDIIDRLDDMSMEKHQREKLAKLVLEFECENRG